MDSRTYYKRQFLNTEDYGGHAFIEASIDEGGTDHFDATFSVADCNRVVELNFGVYGQGAATNVRQKITKFRRAVVAFEKQLLLQLDALDEK